MHAEIANIHAYTLTHRLGKTNLHVCYLILMNIYEVHFWTVNKNTMPFLLILCLFVYSLFTSCLHDVSGSFHTPYMIMFQVHSSSPNDHVSGAFFIPYMIMFQVQSSSPTDHVLDAFFIP